MLESQDGEIDLPLPADVHQRPPKKPIPIKYNRDGFGLGFSVIISAVETQEFESVGNYGWFGVASTLFWIDPDEELIGLLMTQYLPENDWLPLEPQLKALTYQALVD